jgi:hypothetical protein
MSSTALDEAACCPHGYAIAVARADCDHCGDQQAVETTLGLAAKAAITLALVIPPLLFVLALSVAYEHPENAFVAVPLGAFVVIDLHLLPALWDRRRQRR